MNKYKKETQPYQCIQKIVFWCFFRVDGVDVQYVNL